MSEFLGLRSIFLGIEFELPFKVNFVDTGRDENPQDYLPPTNDTTVDLDHDEWLKEIGIGQTALRLKRTYIFLGLTCFFSLNIIVINNSDSPRLICQHPVTTL